MKNPQRDPHFEQIGAGVGRAAAAQLRVAFLQRPADTPL